MSLKQKLLLALTAYVVIALVAWQTIDEPKYRAFVWLLMGLLAFKSVLFWYRESHPVGGRSPR